MMWRVRSHYVVDDVAGPAQPAGEALQGVVRHRGTHSDDLQPAAVAAASAAAPAARAAEHPLARREARGRVWQTVLATSYDAIYLKRPGFKMRVNDVASNRLSWDAI